MPRPGVYGADFQVIESSSTGSVSDHDFPFVYENGRRYCNDTYFLPNDEIEQTRMNIVHQMHLILLDGRLTVVPPPPNTRRILDVGSGPGNWAIAMAEQYPDAEIVATDLSIFDSHFLSLAPPNILFEIDDAEREWTYHEPFDFIHIRHLTRSITDWPAFYAQAFRHLKPGGLIHIGESDISADCLRIPNDAPNSYSSIFCSAIESATEAAGFTRGLAHVSRSALSAAGFIDIRVFDMEYPIGTWPTDPQRKTLGKMALIGMMESVEAFSMRLLTKYVGWTAEDVLDLCDKVKMEVGQWERASCSMRYIIATKPS